RVLESELADARVVVGVVEAQDRADVGLAGGEVAAHEGDLAKAHGWLLPLTARSLQASVPGASRPRVGATTNGGTRHGEAGHRNRRPLGRAGRGRADPDA